MPSSPQRSPFGERKSYSSFDRRTPSRYSRQESSNSTTSSDGEDFRSLAKRMSRTAGSSTQLLDPTARLAAQKKAEAEEKLKLQKQIEEMKTKMNTVETVERTPFSYDPTKVVSQFESEMQEVEVFVEEAPDEETQEYKEWLETVMARGWNEEVKELVSGRKKVSKRNLIRARKRSIVKRYSIIVPELSEEYCLPLEEDEFTEEEKLRLEIEKHFSDIDMDEDIEEISRNRHWSAEIQELVVSKKKINHHNLRNARKRNIVKRLYEKYPGSVYDLCLGPDEFTECEIERQKLHNEIARISVLIEGSDDMESLINHVAEHWGFDSEAIENDKKKTNKKNIFNYLVRSLIGKSQDVFPELEYSIDLEEDEFTEEEQKRRDYEKKLDLINGDFGDKSCDEIAETNEEIILQLQDKNWLVSKENITRLLKRNALAEVYGEDDELMMGQHEVTDGLFDLSDRGHALELIDEKMMSVDEKLNSNDDLGINFPKEVAELNAIHAVLNAENVRLVCLNDALEEALEKYPDSDMELPNSDFELTELGLASKELSEEFGELESLLTAAPDEEFLSDNNWENERSYLRDNNIKENARNIVMRRKQKLYDDYKECYPNNELEEQFVYDEFTAEEIEASKLRENNELYQKVCQAIEQELEGAKISLDRAYKRSGIDHDNLEDHLDEFEWKNEVTQLIKVGIPIKRKPLFELKSRNIISMYQSKYKDFQLGHYLSDPHGYDSDSDTEYSGETGCLTCDIKAKTAFFPSSPSEENYVLDHQVSIEAFADQIIAFPVDSDTDASIPPSPAGNVTSDPLPRYFPPLPEELDDGVAYDVKSIQSLNDANLRPDLFLPESLHLNNINEVECDGPEVQTPTLTRELSGHNSPPLFYADEVHNNGSESPKCNGSHSSLQRDNHAVADPLEREAIASAPQESNVKTSQSRRQSDKSTTETDRLGSIGSDSVFESLSTKTSPISIELTAADSSEDVVLSEANEVSTDDDGDNEFSATDENGLSRKTPTDTARKYDLPGKTATQIQKDSLISSGSSEEIAQLSQTKTNRVPKRKKTSGSGSSVENHSLSKDSSRKPNSLEPRRSLDSKKSHNNSLENDVPCSLLQLPDVNDTKKGPEMPNFDHIKSNYRMEKHNPLIDRKKYIKVPTLEDNIVTSQPLLEGLLPKEFYEQKLSYDLEGTVVDPKQTRPKKNRSKSDIALPATAPTTGHLYWNLMKERKLEREEEGTMITDLDLAIIDKEHVTVVSSQILDNRGNGTSPPGKSKCVRAIVSRCGCKTPFQLDRVGDGKYKLPHTSQIFFVRILRNHVMVRVGGGWDTLDHFIAKHDPCRMKFKHIGGGHHCEVAANAEGKSPSPCQVSAAECSPSPAPSTPSTATGRRSGATPPAAAGTPSRRSSARPPQATPPSSAPSTLGRRSAARLSAASPAQNGGTRRSNTGASPSSTTPSRRVSHQASPSNVHKSSSGGNMRSPSPRTTSSQSTPSSTTSKSASSSTTPKSASSSTAPKTASSSTTPKSASSSTTPKSASSSTATKTASSSTTPKTASSSTTPKKKGSARPAEGQTKVAQARRNSKAAQTKGQSGQ